MNQLESTVRRFFDQAGVVGLLLPDGWFGGRPMESHHSLSFVAVRPKRLLIELDDQLLLTFSGTPHVVETVTELALVGGTPTLVIDSFSQFVFEYLEYVNETPHVLSYAEGRVCLVSPT